MSLMSVFRKMGKCCCGTFKSHACTHISCTTRSSFEAIILKFYNCINCTWHIRKKMSLCCCILIFHVYPLLSFSLSLNAMNNVQFPFYISHIVCHIIIYFVAWFWWLTSLPSLTLFRLTCIACNYDLSSLNMTRVLYLG